MSDPDPGATVAPPTTRGAALGMALAALERLAELGETIEDEWPYVTALAEAGRTRMGSAAGPDPAAPLAPDRAAAVAAACAEIARITDPHRAIDWLSTFPAVVELALVAARQRTPLPRRPRPAGELTTMRFQDAAKDARAVVYAGIQADPLVARLARLAADATQPQRLMARAVMNGESVDPETWRAIFPMVLGADAPDREPAEAILAASLEVAGRGEQARSQFGEPSWRS